MIREIVATAVISGTAYGGLPLAHEYNPEKHSGQYTAKVSQAGRSAQVEIRVFGAEDLAAAQLAGKALTMQYPRHNTPEEMETAMTRKAEFRYGADEWMVAKFVNEARIAYILQMRQLNQKNGLSIQ